MDKRIEYTQKTLKNTFLSLLEKKDITNITVSEICTEAGINRGTFYRYYKNEYDLLQKIQTDFINEIKQANTITYIDKTTLYKFTYDVLKVFENNKKLVSILFNSETSLYFLSSALKISYKNTREAWTNNNKNIDNKELNNAFIFIFHGSFGVINNWIKNDYKESIETIAHYIENYCLNGIGLYIPDKVL